MKVFCGECGAPEYAFHQKGCKYSPLYDLPKPDPVSSPEHYRWLPVEVIEITEHFNFRMGNALKYIMRADHKGKPVEDLKKAVWYLQREIDSRLASEDSR